MSDIYGNRLYPASRKIYSRPYGNGSWGPTGDEEADSISDFRRALVDVGADFIGYPFNLCCDIDNYPAPHFSPPFWHATRFTEFRNTNGYVKYRNSLAHEAGTALDHITAQIAREDYSSDLPKLRDAFKSLWQADIFIDARLIYAEELFFCGADDVQRGGRFDCRDQSRLEGTLEWMAKPENAHRIALMFVHSRVAQHYGELDLRSFAIAKRIVEQVRSGQELGVIQTLSSVPAQYMIDAARSASVMGVVTGKIQDCLVSLFPSLASQIVRPAIKNVEGLKQSAPTIIADFMRLDDSRWAEQQLDKLRGASPSRPSDQASDAVNQQCNA
jgi:hypothetical protein